MLLLARVKNRSAALQTYILACFFGRSLLTWAAEKWTSRYLKVTYPTRPLAEQRTSSSTSVRSMWLICNSGGKKARRRGLP